MERKKGGNGSPDPSDLIFIGYAHESERWLEQVRLPFKPAEMLGLIEVSSDRDIADGDDWENSLGSRLHRAKVAILLIDSHFLTSKYSLKKEVPLLLKRQKKGEIRIIPILVEPCHWQLFPWLKRLQIRRFDKLALSELPRNRVQTHLSAFAWEILESLGVTPPEQPDPDQPSPGSPAAVLVEERGSVTRVLNARHRFGRARDVKDLAAFFCAPELRGGMPKLDGYFRSALVGSFRSGKSAFLGALRIVPFDDTVVAPYFVHLDDGNLVHGYDNAMLLPHADREKNLVDFFEPERRGGILLNGHTRVALVTGLGFETSALLERLVRDVRFDAAQDKLFEAIRDGSALDDGDVMLGFNELLDKYKLWWDGAIRLSLRRDGAIRLSRADRGGGGGGPRRAWVWLGEGVSNRRAFDRGRPPFDAPAIAPELLIHQDTAGRPARPRAWLHHALGMPFLCDPGDRFARNTLLTYLHVPQVPAAPAPGFGYQPLRNYVADPTFFGLPAIRQEIRINNTWADDDATIGRIDNNNDDVDDTRVGSLPPGALIPGHVIYTSGHAIDTCRSTGELLPF